jgi:flavodoxin
MKIKQEIKVIAVIVTIFICFAFVIYKKKQKDPNPIEDNNIVDKTKNYVIGDSQCLNIANNSKKAKLINQSEGENSLWKGGEKLKWLNNAVIKYPISKDVNSIIISIGTNGGFKKTDDIKNLVFNLKQKFPNAKLIAVKGSWGWGYNKKVTLDMVNSYYDIFKQNGVILISKPIGDVENPHKNLPVYKEIGKLIDTELS